MPIKSTTPKAFKKREVQSLPAIVIFSDSHVIGLVVHYNSKYYATVIGNSNSSFPLGWHGTIGLAECELYDGPVTLQNE